jgi:hypothetical protein
MRCAASSILLALLSITQVCAQGGGATHPLHDDANDDWVLGMEELHRLDLLPRLRPSVYVGSISSYDRSGGNDDGFSGKYSYLSKDDNGLTIADLEGPGVIYRIWTPTPSDDVVEFYFDGESKPRIEVPFRQIFTGVQAPFISPLVGYGAGGFYSYVPLPYKKSCRVKVRGERVQFYQINYAQYPVKAPIDSWNRTPSPAYREHEEKAVTLFASAGANISRQVVPEGDKCTTHVRRWTLSPGDTATLFETDRGGRIAGLRITPTAALIGKARNLLLRISWDGEDRPAVLCPLGDFFGYAWGRPAMKSLLVGTNGDVNYCYFPMPFDRSAKIELVSQGSEGPPVEIQAETILSSVPRKENEGKFCAVWRRENPTTQGTPFTFLDAKGQGHIVGCVLQSQGMVSGNTYFFEGDDQTTIDDKLTIHGTGSEDFFNGGWYDVPGRWEKQLSFPLSGCLGYQKHLGRTGGYRLMLGDAYAFRSHIRQTIEHAPIENNLETDYCGVTYFYLAAPPDWEPTVPPVEQRGVVDFKRIVFTPSWNVPVHAFTFRGATISKQDEQIDEEKTSYLSMRAEGQDWFGPPFLSLTCDIPAPGRYSVSMEAVKGPEQARVQLFENEAPVGDAIEMYAAKRHRSGMTVLGDLQLEEGPVNLMLKLIGKHDESKGLGFDLITIQFDRIQ